jgi:hypothetical protein
MRDPANRRKIVEIAKKSIAHFAFPVHDAAWRMKGASAF